jgi:hypothetical protein
MNIDIMLISRERPERFHRMYLSFMTSSAHPERVNFYVGVDSDDPTLDQYLYLGECNNNIHIVDLPDSYNTPNMGSMCLETFKHCKADVVGWFGDDNICMTPGWDEMVEHEFTTALAQHGFKLLFGRDGIQDNRLATWSFMPRKVIELGLLDATRELCIDWIDVYLMQLFASAKCLYYDPALYIKHDHPIAGGAVDHVFIRNRKQEHLDRAFRAWVQCQTQLWVDKQRLIELTREVA